MGIASLILGIVSIILGFIPFCGIIAIIPAIIGIILGIVDLAKKSKERSPKGMSIAGLILSIFAVLFIIFWVVIMASIGANTENIISNEIDNFNNKVDDSNKNNANEKCSVGEVFEDDYLRVKYETLNENFMDYSKYATIKEGYKIIAASFDFENVSDTNQLASYFRFNCYADGYDCSYFYSTEDATFSADLSPSMKSKGTVYFEVPVDAKEIVIEYESNAWSDKKAKFIVK